MVSREVNGRHGNVYVLSGCRKVSKRNNKPINTATQGTPKLRVQVQQTTKCTETDKSCIWLRLWRYVKLWRTERGTGMVRGCGSGHSRIRTGHRPWAWLNVTDWHAHTHARTHKHTPHTHDGVSRWKDKNSCQIEGRPKSLTNWCGPQDHANH